MRTIKHYFFSNISLRRRYIHNPNGIRIASLARERTAVDGFGLMQNLHFMRSNISSRKFRLQFSSFGLVASHRHC